MTECAMDLYQRALDQVSKAVLAGDFAAYVAMLDLPYLVHTLQADLVSHSPAEIEPTFRNMHAGLVEMGATHYERVAREAHFALPDRIEGRHFTHVIANGERLVAPWEAQTALVRRPGGWRFCEASYPFRTDQLPLTAEVMATAGLPVMAGSRAAR
ncbi:MAG: hypothetical protein R3D63_00575 [Paracoccaceae bacterium]